MSIDAAVLRLPLQQRRRQPLALRRLIGSLLLALLPAAIYTTTIGQGWGGFAAGYGLSLLLLLWWQQVEGLQAQNRPLLARLLPGQVAALRRSLLVQGLLVAVAATALIAASSGEPARWLCWVLAVQLLTAWLQREPLLWLPVGLGVTPVFFGINEAQRQLAAAPPALQLLALLAWAWLLAASIGSGGRWHRWQQGRLRDWQQLLKLEGLGRPRPLALRAAPLRWLGRCFDWPQRLHRRRLLGRATPANALARLDLGLGSDGQWPTLLWVLLLIGLGLTLSAVAASAYEGPLDWAQLIDHGRFGLCIGGFSAACSPLLGRANALWARRREQALLMLLPGLPLDPGRALERRWLRQHLIGWGLATALALAIASEGSEGTLRFVAASSACCLPLFAWAQASLRRLDGPGFRLWMAGPALSALPALAAELAGVPAWASLPVGALLFAWGLAATRRGPAIRLPLHAANA